MSYRDYPRIWKTAYYLLADDGAQSVPVGEDAVQRSRGAGRTWQEWAIDMRRLCPDRQLAAVDNHYLTPSNDYRRIPPALKITIRTIWKQAHKRGLYDRGVYIVESVMG